MSNVTSIRFVFRAGNHPVMGIIKHKLTVNLAENMIIQSVFPFVGNRISYRYPVDSKVTKDFFDYALNSIKLEDFEGQPQENFDKTQHYKISLLYDDGSVKVIEGIDKPSFGDELVEKLNNLVDYRERIFIF